MDCFELPQSFIENYKRITSLRELTELFGVLAHKIGCTHFVCMSHVNALNPPNDAIVLTDYPMEWRLIHSEKQYHCFDPIHHTCKNNLTPFTWSSETWRYFLSLEQSNMLVEASEFGLGEGHTIPIHPPTGYATSLSVVFEPGELDPEVLNALHLIALGKSNWYIGAIMFISESTVKDHVTRIFKTLNVRTRQQALVKALFNGNFNYLDFDVSPPSKSDEKTGFVHLRLLAHCLACGWDMEPLGLPQDDSGLTYAAFAIDVSQNGLRVVRKHAGISNPILRIASAKIAA